jgi:hypothetical protein
MKYMALSVQYMKYKADNKRQLHSRLHFALCSPTSPSRNQHYDKTEYIELRDANHSKRMTRREVDGYTGKPEDRSVAPGEAKENISKTC